MTAPTPPRAGPAGSIYDLGYRGYDGPRLGRRHAVATLIRDAFRACWGIGRSGRAKIVPFGLFALAMIPAVVAVGVSALVSQLGQAGGAFDDEAIIGFSSYFEYVWPLVALFVAAQAPELVGGDQRHRVLALLFARALRREDYAGGKLVALVAALLLLLLIPQAVILLGRALVPADVVEAIVADAAQVPAVIGQAILTAVFLGSLGLAIAAYTPRRAFATAGIIAVLIVPPLVSAVAVQLVGESTAGWLTLFSPPDILEGTNAFFFDLTRTGAGRSLPDVAWPLASMAWSVVAMGALLWRYRTIQP
jgi:ABC-2 type transport system permease protein